MQNTQHFGEHLTIDGYGGSAEYLNQKERVEQVLMELPKILGMNRLSEPEVILAPENDQKDPGGWSGFVIIAESHISLHTFPRRRFVSADVYTCKNGLDVNLVIDYFKEIFALESVEQNFIIRGKNYPKENLV